PWRVERPDLDEITPARWTGSSVGRGIIRENLKFVGFSARPAHEPGAAVGRERVVRLVVVVPTVERSEDRAGRVDLGGAVRFEKARRCKGRPRGFGGWDRFEVPALEKDRTAAPGPAVAAIGKEDGALDGEVPARRKWRGLVRHVHFRGGLEVHVEPWI